MPFRICEELAGCAHKAGRREDCSRPTKLIAMLLRRLCNVCGASRHCCPRFEKGLFGLIFVTVSDDAPIRQMEALGAFFVPSRIARGPTLKKMVLCGLKVCTEYVDSDDGTILDMSGYVKSELVPDSSDEMISMALAALGENYISSGLLRRRMTCCFMIMITV